MNNTTELIKDKECARCDKWLDCKGKPPKTFCINFQERKDNKRDDT